MDTVWSRRHERPGEYLRPDRGGVHPTIDHSEVHIVPHRRGLLFGVDAEPVEDGAVELTPELDDVRVCVEQPRDLLSVRPHLPQGQRWPLALVPKGPPPYTPRTDARLGNSAGGGDENERIGMEPRDGCRIRHPDGESRWRRVGSGGLREVQPGHLHTGLRSVGAIDRTLRGELVAHGAGHDPRMLLLRVNGKQGRRKPQVLSVLGEPARPLERDAARARVVLVLDVGVDVHALPNPHAGFGRSLDTAEGLP